MDIPEHLAYAEIRRIGIGGEFLTSPYTLKHCRQATWTPRLAYRGQILPETDRSRLHDRLEHEIKRRLAACRPPELPPKLQEEMIAMLRKNGISLQPEWFAGCEGIV